MVPCLVCGAECRRTPSVLAARSGAAYCTREHYWQANKGRKRAQRVDAGSRRAAYVEKPCAFCGSVVSRRVTDSRLRHFCNRSCAGKQSRIEGRSGRLALGHRRVSEQGYVLVRVGLDHPMSQRGGWCLEHRLVMSQVVSRALLTEETVHHRNGVRDDNRPENLELWSSPQKPGQRAIELLAWARHLVELYEPIEGLLT